MAKYLDETGVGQLWNKCKDTFATKEKTFISLDSATTIALNSTSGIELNKWYKVDGFIEFCAEAHSSGTQTSTPTYIRTYRTIYNGMFKVTAATGSIKSSSPYATATISITYCYSRTTTSAGAMTTGDTTANSTTGNYNKGYSNSAKFQGIITKLN